MTYRGHSVLNTLIRCRFSPAYSTGQRYIYTGCAAGRVVIYDLLTGKIQSILRLLLALVFISTALRVELTINILI